MSSAAEAGTVRVIDALSPFDGRYAGTGAELSPFFSEGGLMAARVRVETGYLESLSDAGYIRPLAGEEREFLYRLGTQLDDTEKQKIKSIESKTHHDVHAAVVFLQETLGATSLADVTEFIHFGLTSEDVNNLAWRMNLLAAGHNVMEPALSGLIDRCARIAETYKATPMLARTHGQPAIPTTFGKEIINVAVRLHLERQSLQAPGLRGKLNGAVGNYSAMTLLYPGADWISFSDLFIRKLGLEPNHFTTQVNPNDDIAQYLQTIARINSVIHGFDRDMWRYISDDLVVQKIEGVGSSTMSQKINPIQFEHSEGMIEMANGMIGILASQLVESRLQRDLSDSPLFRFLGEIHATTLDAWRNTVHGLDRSRPDEVAMREMLERNWAILSEPVQLLLRQHGIAGGYELLRSLTQGKQFTRKQWMAMTEELIETLPITDSTLQGQLRAITPQTYIGQAVTLTDMGIREIRTYGD